MSERSRDWNGKSFLEEEEDVKNLSEELSQMEDQEAIPDGHIKTGLLDLVPESFTEQQIRDAGIPRHLCRDEALVIYRHVEDGSEVEAFWTLEGPPLRYQKMMLEGGFVLESITFGFSAFRFRREDK